MASLRPETANTQRWPIGLFLLLPLFSAPKCVELSDPLLAQERHAIQTLFFAQLSLIQLKFFL